MGQRTQLLVAYHNAVNPHLDFSISLHFQWGFARVMTEAAFTIASQLTNALMFKGEFAGEITSKEIKEYHRYALSTLAGLVRGSGIINLGFGNSSLEDLQRLFKEYTEENSTGLTNSIPDLALISKYENYFQEYGVHSSAYHESVKDLFNSDNNNGYMILDAFEDENFDVCCQIRCFNSQLKPESWTNLVNYDGGSDFADLTWKHGIRDLFKNHEIEIIPTEFTTNVLSVHPVQMK